MREEALNKVLIVEDDPDIHSFMAMHLNKKGYCCTVVEDGISALEKVLTETYNMIILDMMLPQLDGLQLLQRIRSRDQELPVLILSARTEIKEKITALELGADDYLTKPFSPDELVARLKVLLRRRAIKAVDTQDVLSFAGLEINRIERTVLNEGKNLSFRTKEFDLLWHMASYPRRTFTRAELLESVWGFSSEAYEHTVTSHINRLRSKLENLNYINTVWGVGYRFLNLDEV
jgi:two-component system alkaline phosphatase synthesis response regulator PhoP